MARVTIEDCLKHVDNRFDLVLKSAERARQLESGDVDPLVSVDNDKPTVLALREIAAGHDVSPSSVNAMEEAERALFADPSEFSFSDQRLASNPGQLQPGPTTGNPSGQWPSKDGE